MSLKNIHENQYAEGELSPEQKEVKLLEFNDLAFGNVIHTFRVRSTLHSRVKLLAQELSLQEEQETEAHDGIFLRELDKDLLTARSLKDCNPSSSTAIESCKRVRYNFEHELSLQFEKYGFDLHVENIWNKSELTYIISCAQAKLKEELELIELKKYSSRI
jgi:hypothetical protein